MAIRYYIVPVVGKGFNRETGRKPKYLGEIGGLKQRTLYYGHLPVVLLRADVTQVLHDSVSANSDVISFPLNIDNQVGAALTTVKTKMTAAQIPNDWVLATMTYRQILRRLEYFFQFVTRYQGRLAHELITTLWDNDTTIADMTAATLEDVQGAATSLGLTDFSGITTSSTLGEAMVTLAKRWQDLG